METAETPPQDDKACWREVLEAALNGVFPTGPYLERLIDIWDRAR